MENYVPLREVGQEPPPLNPKEEYERGRNKHGYGNLCVGFRYALFIILLSVWMLFVTNTPAPPPFSAMTSTPAVSTTQPARRRKLSHQRIPRAATTHAAPI